MRMSFRQWFASRVRPPWERNKRERKPGKGTAKHTWIIAGERFVAFTRSEARALAKREWGFKGRLPVGIAIRKAG